MQRDVLAQIFEWNNKVKRKPLVLMGARQVGKTWLMDAFGSSIRQCCRFQKATCGA